MKKFTEEQLLDLVRRWHNGEGAEKSLDEFLEITPLEYKAWVEGRLDLTGTN